MVFFTINSVSSFYPTGTSAAPTGSIVGSTSGRTGTEGKRMVVGKEVIPSMINIFWGPVPLFPL